MEQSYDALHAAGRTKLTLMGSVTGMALGVFPIGSREVPQVEAAPSVYSSDTLAIASGRVSLVLGLHGPCISFETACSASLVACHSAMRAIRHGECETHVAAGVNVMLAPAFSIAAASEPRAHVRPDVSLATLDAVVGSTVRGRSGAFLTRQSSHALRCAEVRTSPHPGWRRLTWHDQAKERR